MGTLLVWAVPWFVGASLLFSALLPHVPWLGRPDLAARLGPYTAGRWDRSNTRQGSLDSIDEMLTRVASASAVRLSAWLGGTDPLERRLERTHASEEPRDVRSRQGRWMAAGFVIGVVLAASLPAPPLVAVFFVVGPPLLAVLAVEYQVSAASARWQRRISLELPTVAEQLGMLLSAGRSLGGALGAIAQRGSGATAQDLRRVVQRTEQGLSEAAALAEWAEVSDVAAVGRLVSIFALNQQSADLGALVSEEARTLRREAHRELVEDIERRTEQVWIPVTVAALLPGALLIGVPFIDALRLFSAA